MGFFLWNNLTDFFLKERLDVQLLTSKVTYIGSFMLHFQNFKHFKYKLIFIYQILANVQCIQCHFNVDKQGIYFQPNSNLNSTKFQRYFDTF